MTKEAAKKYRIGKLKMSRGRLSDEIVLSIDIINFYESGKTPIPNWYEDLLKTVKPNKTPAGYPRIVKTRETVSIIDSFILSNLVKPIDDIALILGEKKSYVRGRIAYLRRVGKI